MRPGTVLLLMSLEYRYSREAAMGVRQFLREHGGWGLHIARPEPAQVRPWLKNHRELMGVIGFLPSPTLENTVARLGLPVVNIAGRMPRSRFPRVLPDNHAVGRLGADHLLARGFRQLAFIAERLTSHYLERQQGFLERAAEADASATSRLWQSQRSLAAWLRRQPKPLGIMAVHDAAARRVLAACQEAHLAVPDDVAIVGAENSETHCELAPVPLSSVETEGRRVGYEAARLLDRLIQKKPAPTPIHRVPVATVVARRSTDIVAVEDPTIAEALRFIRQHGAGPLTIDDVAAHVVMARRTLEKRFRKSLARTPHEELLRLRLERARDLLVTTDMKISEVARRSGFGHARHFMATFRDAHNATPTNFRRQHRRV